MVLLGRRTKGVTICVTTPSDTNTSDATETAAIITAQKSRRYKSRKAQKCNFLDVDLHGTAANCAVRMNGYDRRGFELCAVLISADKCARF